MAARRDRRQARPGRPGPGGRQQHALQRLVRAGIHAGRWRAHQRLGPRRRLGARACLGARGRMLARRVHRRPVVPAWAHARHRAVPAQLQRHRHHGLPGAARAGDLLAHVARPAAAAAADAGRRLPARAGMAVHPLPRLVVRGRAGGAAARLLHQRRGPRDRRRRPAGDRWHHAGRPRAGQHGRDRRRRDPLRPLPAALRAGRHAARSAGRGGRQRDPHLRAVPDRRRRRGQRARGARASAGAWVVPHGLLPDRRRRFAGAGGAAGGRLPRRPAGLRGGDAGAGRSCARADGRRVPLPGRPRTGLAAGRRRDLLRIRREPGHGERLERLDAGQPPGARSAAHRVRPGARARRDAGHVLRRTARTPAAEHGPDAVDELPAARGGGARVRHQRPHDPGARDAPRRVARLCVRRRAVLHGPGAGVEPGVHHRAHPRRLAGRRLVARGAAVPLRADPPNRGVRPDGRHVAVRDRRAEPGGAALPPAAWRCWTPRC